MRQPFAADIRIAALHVHLIDQRHHRRFQPARILQLKAQRHRDFVRRRKPDAVDLVDHPVRIFLDFLNRFLTVDPLQLHDVAHPQTMSDKELDQIFQIVVAFF